MRNRWSFSCLLLVVLMLSGCWFMGLEGVIERKLEERYEMSFRVVKMLSINDNKPELRRRALVRPVDYPDLEFPVFISQSHQLEDEFLDYYGEYRVAQFFQQLADEVGLDAVVQGIGTYSDESRRPTVLSRPLNAVDPVQIMKDNMQWVYVILVLVRADTPPKREQGLEQFNELLHTYQQRYPGLPKVVFQVSVGDAQQVAEAMEDSPRYQMPDDYHYIFRREALLVPYQDGVVDVTAEEIAQYFLSEPPATLPPFERQSQESVSHN